MEITYSNYGAIVINKPLRVQEDTMVYRQLKCVVPNYIMWSDKCTLIYSSHRYQQYNSKCQLYHFLTLGFKPYRTGLMVCLYLLYFVYHVYWNIWDSRAIGTLIVPCWPSANYWSMLCPSGSEFIDQVIGYIDLPVAKMFYILQSSLSTIQLKKSALSFSDPGIQTISMLMLYFIYSRLACLYLLYF
jgi:hypothetical protein